jgi:hypothetical protein
MNEKRKEFEENIFLKFWNETELTATVNSFRYRTKWELVNVKIEAIGLNFNITTVKLN